MMNPLPEETIDELVQQKLEGESYSVIRARLTDMGFSKDEIKAIILKVDDRVLQTEVELGRKRKFRSWYIAGLVLAVAGLLLSAGSNAGLILIATPRWLVYSPFFAGILMMFYGRMQQRKQIDNAVTRTDRIRRKRPFK